MSRVLTAFAMAVLTVSLAFAQRPLRAEQSVTENTIEGTLTLFGRAIRLTHAYAKIDEHPWEKSKKAVFITFTNQPVAKSVLYNDAKLRKMTARNVELIALSLTIDDSKHVIEQVIHNLDLYTRDDLTPPNGTDQITLYTEKTIAGSAVKRKVKAADIDFQFNVKFKLALQPTGYSGDFAEEVDADATSETNWQALINEGDIKKLKASIQNNSAFVKERDKCQATPLHYAARNANQEVIALLLTNKADVNAKDKSGYTPLHYATEVADSPKAKAVVELLIKNRADVNAQTTTQKTYVVCPEDEDRPEGGVPSEQQYNVPPPSPPPPSGKKRASQSPMPPPPPGKKGSFPSPPPPPPPAPSELSFPPAKDFSGGDTPLHLAAIHSEDRGIIEILLANKANPKVRNKEGLSPLHSLAYNQAGAEMAAVLLAKGADVNAKDDQGRTALHEASVHSNPELVKVLLEHKADVNARDGFGNTPLHIPGQLTEEAEAVTQLLLAQGADVRAKNNSGGTPLHAAVDLRNANMVKLLLAQKADVNAKTTDGRTPLHIAAVQGVEDSPEIAKMLIANKADVNATDSHGRTPLFGAAYFGYEPIVKVLLAAKANPNVKDSEGRTPLQMATAVRRQRIINLLRAYGAKK